MATAERVLTSVFWKKFQYRIVILSAFIVPCSGYVFLGRSGKGLMMLCWLFTFGYITYQLTGDHIHFTGRIAGALAIWTLSVVDTANIMKRRIEKSPKG